MITGTVRLAPEQREQLAYDIGRLVVWLARVLHVPWWASALLLLAVLASAMVAAVWRPRKKPTTTRTQPVDRRPVYDFAFCGHCGHVVPPSRRAVSAGVPLCFPAVSGGRDCFHLVTVGGHTSDGNCRCGGHESRMSDSG